MIGLFIGIAAGLFQFWLLSKFTKLITRGSMNPKALLLGLSQFFLPMLILVGVAFIKRQDLFLAAVGITATLIIGAITKHVINTRRLRGREDNNV